MSVSPEHVVVLAPGAIETNGLFADVQDDTYLGGQVRLEAAAELARSDLSVELTLVGGYNKIGEGDPNTSRKVTDMARFILGHAPEAQVDSVFSLPCTRHNFIAILNKWAQSDMKVEEIGILTNDYHLPRALELAERAAFDTEDYGSVRFTPVSAEDLLGLTGEQHYGQSQGAYLARLASEARGLAELHSGQYVDSCLTENLEQLRFVLAEHAFSLLAADEYETVEGSLQKISA
jgi:hypothetical protein